jgi:hypothetical protein
MANPDLTKPEYYYIYTVKDGRCFYERTTTGRKAAEDRIATLKTRGQTAFWSTGTVKDAFY